MKFTAFLAPDGIHTVYIAPDCIVEAAADTTVDHNGRHNLTRVRTMAGDQLVRETPEQVIALLEEATSVR